MSSNKNVLSDFSNKKIAILGLGIENIAMLKYLLKQDNNLDFTICDARAVNQLGDRYEYFSGFKNISWQLGSKFNQVLDKFDIMFRSPGWPIHCPGVQKALLAGVKLESPMRLFFELCPTVNIIGVTGTKGKGTTSSLIYEILKQDGRDVYLGGNIGKAPFAFFEQIKDNSWVILELSSFQLEDLENSPRIAVFTNLYEDHLAPADPHNPNYHDSMEDYCFAKTNIFSWQNAKGKLVINKKLEDKIIKHGEAFAIPGEVVYFTKSKLKSSLVGEHNRENIAAAVTVANLLGISEDVVETAVLGFKGLPFRTEFIAEIAGVKYYNDSFATTPDSTIIALNSFAAPIVLLAGGSDKGADFSALAQAITDNVRFVLLFKGKGSEGIKNVLYKAAYPAAQIVEVDSMEKAFLKLREISEAGDIVLLSTACASFGVFKSYKERGMLFNEEVEKLK